MANTPRGGVQQSPGIQLLEDLRAPFEPSDLGWRAMFTRAPQGNQRDPLILVAPYVDRPALINRLNQVCGIGGWQSDARVSAGHVYIGIGIRVGEIITPGSSVMRYEWVWRWDGTGFLDAEPPHFTAASAGKGNFSNGFKRTCEMFGIATYLREMKPVRAIINSEGQYKSKIEGMGVVKWSPPSITGTPSYPGEIPGFIGREEGGEIATPDAPDATTEPAPREPTVPAGPPTDVEAEDLLADHKTRVRTFMRDNGLQVYNLEALLQLHPKLKDRCGTIAELNRIGTHNDWAEVELLTREKQMRWDEAPKELAKEFPTGPDRVELLRKLIEEHKPTGKELIIINTAISVGWSDGVEFWITKLQTVPGAPAPQSEMELQT